MYEAIKLSQNLLIKVINKFGMRSQKNKAIEELSELIQALSKDLNGEKHNVEEEIADVEIMLAQMRLIYNQPIINEFIDAKLERLKSRFNEI